MSKLSMLMKALILEGLVQVVQDVQDVLKAPTGPAFSIEELGVRRLFGRGVGAGSSFVGG